LVGVAPTPASSQPQKKQLQWFPRAASPFVAYAPQGKLREQAAAFIRVSGRVSLHGQDAENQDPNSASIPRKSPMNRYFFGLRVADAYSQP
jgi:hypothetical protein